MPRLPDRLRIEIVGGSSAVTLDNFTSFMVTNDLMMPSEAAFETGNDDSWAQIEKLIAHGTKYRVFLNDLLRVTGRVEVQDIPIDATAGSVVRFTIRTKLADAMYAAADPKVRVRDTTIKQFILDLYEPLGFSESDFLFEQGEARDLLTGKETKQKGSPKKTNLERITMDEARIRIPETIYDAADRHLRRHGLIHWDSPDGRIVVGGINDTQDPIFHLRINSGPDGRENNVLKATRARDWSGIPSHLFLFGINRRRGSSRERIGAFEPDVDLIDAGFYRPVIINAETIRTNTVADRAAKREMSARSKRKDAWDMETDGLSYWDGRANIPWGVDTVVNVTSNQAGGMLGAYYIYRVVSRRNAADGDITNLGMLARGIWKL